MTIGTVTGIVFSPLLPLPLVAAIGLLLFGLLVFGLTRRMPGMLWRGIVLGALVLALLNPSLVEEQRESLPDLALVLIDRSPSQIVGERREQTDRTVAALAERLSRLGNLEVRVAEVGPGAPGASDALPGSGTRLFGAIRNALADVHRESISGVIMVTDGAVHDVPESIARAGLAAPVHVLVSGHRGEADRRLEVIEAPRYGVVDKPLSIVFRVHDSESPAAPVRITVTTPDGREIHHVVAVGERQEVRVVLDHAGLSVVHLDVEAGANEITTINNHAVLPINGVRENLKVLLVSGEAHTGERIWRNTLKSDPSVELIHFTILRPPEKQDATPIRELALIAFPVRELFESRLSDFDLVIFDRYRKRGVIPEAHLLNIADYVVGGGAMMVAAGPDFSTPLGLHSTVLGELMPAVPTGEVHVEPFHVGATPAGLRHPITAELAGIAADVPPWGRWFRHVDATAVSGDTLLDGVGDAPLLVVGRAGNGRVAELLSDHIWLWSRGFEGGGPSTELLRRIVHWLMKEPDLEENALTATATNDRITVIRRSMEDGVRDVTITSPSGEARTLTLEPLSPGRAEADITAGEAGLFHIVDGGLETWVSVGSHNPLEWRDPRATAEILQPLVDEAGGRLSWIAHDPLPTVRRVTAGRDVSGPGWIGLLDHDRYIVRSIDVLALVPPWLLLMLFVAGLAAAWRAEGR